MTLFFDESGNTGVNLVTRDRPYFVLASVSYTSEELDQIWIECGLISIQGEVHFDKLKKSTKGRTLLKSVLIHPLVNEQHIVCAVVEKRFCLYAQIIDVLIETYVYSNFRKDIHSKHQSLVWANFLYYAMICHPNQILVQQIEDCFVKMVRVQDAATVAEFYNLLNILKSVEDTNPKLHEFIDLLLCTRGCIANALTDDESYLDPTLTVFCDIIQRWKAIDSNAVCDVIMDTSKVMDVYKSMVDKLSHVPQMEVGYGSRRHNYPLPIGSFKIKESHTERGLQMADIIASAYGHILSKNDKKNEYFRQEIEKSNLSAIHYVGIYPSTVEYIDELLKNYNGVDVNPLDYLCKVL